MAPLLILRSQQITMETPPSQVSATFPQSPDTLEPPHNLPLAANKEQLSRPFFKTVHLDISAGLAFCDFSDVQKFTGGSSGLAFMLSSFIEIPLHHESPLSILSGLGFALGGVSGGSLYNVSTIVLYRHPGRSIFKPVIGVGYSKVDFRFVEPSERSSSGSLQGAKTGSVVIDAGEWFPILIGGVSLQPDVADILLAIPLANDLETSFESNGYRIQPAGITLSVLLSL